MRAGTRRRPDRTPAPRSWLDRTILHLTSSPLNSLSLSSRCVCVLSSTAAHRAPAQRLASWISMGFNHVHTRTVPRLQYAVSTLSCCSVM